MSQRIVVLGTSAGGTRALEQLVAGLPSNFPAPIFVVRHMSPVGSADELLGALNRHGQLPCSLARHGERFEARHIYVAPPDHHLLLKAKTVLVTRGARENRYRPAIDPLFRSAAVAFGSRVISVILTGELDDGTEGTAAVRRCGGTTVVQDPRDAEHPAMPRSASAAGVDHCVALEKMAPLLHRLALQRPVKHRAVPADIRVEARIAERVLSDVQAVDGLGDQVPCNCPGCGGTLWEIYKSRTLRYRCHTGHSYTSESLFVEQSIKIEETLWVMLRMLEERRNLLRAMRARGTAADSAVERERDTEVHIQRIREMLNSGKKRSSPEPTRPRASGWRARSPAASGRTGPKRAH